MYTYNMVLHSQSTDRTLSISYWISLSGYYQASYLYFCSDWMQELDSTPVIIHRVAFLFAVVHEIVVHILIFHIYANIYAFMFIKHQSKLINISINYPFKSIQPFNERNLAHHKPITSQFPNCITVIAQKHWPLTAPHQLGSSAVQQIIESWL